MTINFYLEKRKARKNPELHIVLWIREGGKALKVGTHEHILPKYWDLKKQRPKLYTPGAEELTDMLDAWEAEIKAIRRTAKASGKQLTFEYLKKNLSFIRQHNGTFFGVWEEYKKHKMQKHKSGTLKVYDTAWKTLKVIDGSHPGLHDKDYKRYNSMDRERAYHKEKGAYKIDFGSINNDFVNRLIDYSVFMEYKNEFCNQVLTRVKAFMNWAVQQEYIKDDEFRNLKTELIKRDDDSNIYFLLADELAHLTYMKIKDERLDKVRDIFCFGCYTGLRYSDIENFKKDNVIEDQYRLTQKKTGKSLTNPLFEPAQNILKKYADLPGAYALPAISNQKMNDYLKELGKLAGFSRKITLYTIIGAQSKEESFPLHSLMSTHTARKTFITYLINSGMDKNIVMAYTGQSANVIERYYEILGDYKKEQAAKLNKKFKKDAANGRKLRKV